MSDEDIPGDIWADATKAAVEVSAFAVCRGPSKSQRISVTKAREIIARAILAERNRVHKQLKGEE